VDVFLSGGQILANKTFEELDSCCAVFKDSMHNKIIVDCKKIDAFREKKSK